MQHFYEHLEYAFENTNAAFKVDSTGAVSVITKNISEQECDEIIKKHLNSLDLFANKIREAQSHPGAQTDPQTYARLINRKKM